MRRYAKPKTGDFPPALTALVAVPTLGILPRLLLSAGLTLVVLLRDLINAHVVELGRIPGTRDFVDCARHPEAEKVHGVVLVRRDKPLFFASTSRVHAELSKSLPPATQGSVPPAVLPAPTFRAFIISMELTSTLDVTSTGMLRQFRAEALQSGPIRMA